MSLRLDEVSVRAFVPRDDPVGAVAAELLRRACGKPFIDAVDVAAQALHRLDPGAYWVIRELGVRVSVPASEADPHAQAGRLAAALVAAIERTVRRGPNPDVVRFAGPGEFAASFVRAQLAGAGDAWVYDRVATLRGLRPTDAVVSVAAAVDVPVLEVFAGLVALGGVERLLVAATPGELERLDAALARANPGSEPVPLRLLDIATELAAAVPVLAGLRPSSAAAARLDLLARLIATVPATAALVGAVHAVRPDRPTPAANVVGTALPVPVARRAGASPPVSRSIASDRPWTFVAPGAVAGLMLPDLDELIAAAPPGLALGDASPTAAAIRRDVLATVVGVATDDAAVAVLAGIDPGRSADADAVVAQRAAAASWIADLADDPRWPPHPEDPDWLGDGPAEIVGLAGVVLRRFAARLTGFGRAPAGYLAERVLPAGGTVVAAWDSVQVSLPPAPLQIVLALAGLDTFVVRPRWLDAPITVTHREAA